MHNKEEILHYSLELQRDSYLSQTEQQIKMLALERVLALKNQVAERVKVVLCSDWHTA